MSLLAAGCFVFVIYALGFGVALYLLSYAGACMNDPALDKNLEFTDSGRSVLFLAAVWFLSGPYYACMSLLVKGQKRGFEDRTLIRTTWWRHYKGGLYERLFIATHSETGDYLVIYRDKLRRGWARPLDMWSDLVDEDGTLRFTPESEAKSA